MKLKITPQQHEAAEKLRKGNILCASTGAGKTRTALLHYYLYNGGCDEPFKFMSNPKDLYVITTAKKRDDRDWQQEMIPFCMNPDGKNPYPGLKIVVDSWNNIQKYKNVTGAFFIFDEQRVTGDGPWVQSFYKIAKNNYWILLTATPGDRWKDYIPVFVANGFFKNRSEFIREHCVLNPYVKWLSINDYKNVGRLIRLRRKVLVDMDVERSTIQHHENIWCLYNKTMYKTILKTRMNPETGIPFRNASELCIALRKEVNSDEDRIRQCISIVRRKQRAIIFYNFDFELNILRTKIPICIRDCKVAEWNGHKHQEVPSSEKWVYLVQYNAGSEGWNCIQTDTIIFFSANYSYKVMLQSAGRIDRFNTPYKNLYYYHLTSHSGIDLAINETLERKKKFNEERFVNAL